MSRWPFVELSSVLASLESGTRPKGGATTCGIPSIGGEHVHSNGFINLDVKTFIPIEFFNSLRKGRLQDGDILVVKDGATTGKTGVVRFHHNGYQAAVNEHVFIVRANETKCLQRYIYHLLCSPFGNRMIMTDFRGAAQGGISRDFVTKVKFTLPNLDEQSRIVEFLDRAVEIRHEADGVRVKARTVIPALFLDTFGDPASNPKGWETKRLGDMVDLSGGGTPAKTNTGFWNGEIPWISPKDMKPPTICGSEVKITEAGMRASPVKLIPGVPSRFVLELILARSPA